MPNTFKLSGHVFDNTGTARGATVLRYETGTTTVKGTSTTAHTTTGLYEFTDGGNAYDLKITYGDDVRWLRAKDRMGIAELTIIEPTDDTAANLYIAGDNAANAGDTWRAQASGTAGTFTIANNLADTNAFVNQFTLTAHATPASTILTLTGGLTAGGLITANGGITFAAGDDIAFTGSTGTNDITLTDSLADALSITRGGTDMVLFDSSTPRITFAPVTTFTGAITASGGVAGALTGNADTATALASGRTIAMTGDVAWTSASFDGSGNVTGAGTIQANAVEGSMLNNNTISGQTEITSGLAAADELLYDDGGVLKKIGLDNFVELTPALATEDAIANGDYILFLDGGASGSMNKEAVHDLATLFAGTGLTASSSVIGVDVAQTGITSLGTQAANFAVGNGYGIVIGTDTQETVSIGDGSTDLVPELQVLGTAAADSSMLLAAFSNTATTAGSPILAFAKGGNATLGSHTVVTDGEELGNIIAFGDDGTDLETPAASIQFEVDGTPGSGDMPGRIILGTTADGATAVTEAVRIDSLQNTTFAGEIRVVPAASAADDGIADTKGTGLVATMRALTGIAVGELVHIDANGDLDEAHADATADMPAIGIALTANASGSDANIQVLLQGFYRDDSQFSFGTMGAPVYVDHSTEGDFTLTPSTTDGHFIQRVGISVTDDMIYFNPSLDVIERD